MWLFLFFVAIPVIEIGLFVQVGGWLGLWPTLAIVILTAFIGSNLLRQQGLATLPRLQGSVSKGENPMDPIAHAAMILVSGVLLLTPGFFTDGVGFALLLPPVRKAVIRWGAAQLLQNNTVVFYKTTRTGPDPATRSDVVDADFTILEEDPPKPGNSGWTKPKE